MKFFAVLLSFIIFFSPLTAFAGAAEQWTIEKVVYDDIGKTLNYTASRPNAIARNDYVYKAKVAVDAAKTGSTAASMIRYGLAGVAIVGIVESVGWIIENGVVKKLDPSVDSSSSTSPYIWQFGNFNNPDTSCNSNKPKFYSPSSAMSKLQECVEKSYGNVENFSCSISSLTQYICRYKRDGGINGDSTINRSTNTSYDPSYQPSYIPVSDTELGEAIEKSPAAPQVIPDIYSPANPVPRPSPAPDAVQTALDNADPEPRKPPTSDTEKKPNKDTNADGVPDQYDSSLPDRGETTTWPPACEWFPAACEFFKVQKQDNKEIKENQQKQLAQDKTFFEKVTDFIDFIMGNFSEPEIDKPEVPITDLEQQEIKDDLIQIHANSCPADIQFDVQGLPFGIQINRGYQMQPICNTLEPLKYVFHLITVCICAFILLRI